MREPSVVSVCSNTECTKNKAGILSQSMSFNIHLSIDCSLTVRPRGHDIGPDNTKKQAEPTLQD